MPATTSASIRNRSGWMQTVQRLAALVRLAMCRYQASLKMHVVPA
jgi:hypothetical protein